MTINFKGTECTVVFTNYASNGNNAITLYEKETGDPFASASTNIDITLPYHNVAIKNWSENEGMLEVLQAAGIVGSPIMQYPSGMVQIPVCKILKRE